MRGGEADFTPSRSCKEIRRCRLAASGPGIAALATSGQLAENVNYAVKSSFLLSFLESLPAVTAKLKEPNTRERKFEEVVKEAQEAAALVLVY
jgi:hypothetical protein